MEDANERKPDPGRDGASSTHVSLVAADVSDDHADATSLPNPSVTPELEALPRLSGNGIGCRVVDGMTIGCRRDSARAFPDIAVDARKPENAYVSQIQGRFDADGEGWRFTNLGRNKCTVYRSETMRDILSGESARLADGDVISMAGGDGIRFSTPGMDA